MKSLYRDLTRRPFCIVTPNCTHASRLNHTGERAYILACGGSDTVVRSDWLTPLPPHPMAHERQGLTPIVVYREVVTGNPRRVARYVLSHPGLSGRETGIAAQFNCYRLIEVFFDQLAHFFKITKANAAQSVQTPTAIAAA
jgi:hypothetical protein